MSNIDRSVPFSDLSRRVQRWCGICFAWREQGSDGRCVSCGNAHMTGESIPLALDEEEAS